MKKKEDVKVFMVKNLVELVSNTRMVKIILEVMKKKFTKCMGEKISNTIRIVSYFKNDGKIDNLLNKFKK